MDNYLNNLSAFTQADTNKDGNLDFNEFQNFIGSSIDNASSASSGANDYGSYSSNTIDTGAGGYESISYSNNVASDGVTSYNGDTSGYGSSNVENSQYATDAQGIFQDPNPKVIRRAAVGGPQTYTQNIKVRFLQPPPLPPPGPLIIKEVRPPQPPAPAPLRIRQRAPPLPTPPPLVLRERPPVPPPVIPSQTVIRRLPGLPVPPRSVIIERLPPLPPKPRDIIIERWVPYGPQAKRQTIIQRAPAPKPYPVPRNVIIQYEPVGVRVVRQFQRLGVTQADPSTYVQQYGASLLDGNSLIAQARAAGVVEDISAPGFGFGAASYGQDVVGDSFSAADTNKDGALDQAEFNNFLNQNLV